MKRYRVIDQDRAYRRRKRQQEKEKAYRQSRPVEVGVPLDVVMAMADRNKREA